MTEKMDRIEKSDNSTVVLHLPQPIIQCTPHYVHIVTMLQLCTHCITAAADIRTFLNCLHRSHHQR